MYIHVIQMYKIYISICETISNFDSLEKNRSHAITTVTACRQGDPIPSLGSMRRAFS